MTIEHDVLPSMDLETETYHFLLKLESDFQVLKPVNLEAFVLDRIAERELIFCYLIEVGEFSSMDKKRLPTDVWYRVALQFLRNHGVVEVEDMRLKQMIDFLAEEQEECSIASYSFQKVRKSRVVLETRYA